MNKKKTAQNVVYKVNRVAAEQVLKYADVKGIHRKKNVFNSSVKTYIKILLCCH